MASKPTKTCYCAAYPFPHRWKSGACAARKPHKRTRARYKAMMRRRRNAR
jgi:hypothetical protein